MGGVAMELDHALEMVLPRMESAIRGGRSERFVVERIVCWDVEGR
jgi:hypothetical protein